MRWAVATEGGVRHGSAGHGYWKLEWEAVGNAWEIEVDKVVGRIGKNDLARDLLRDGEKALLHVVPAGDGRAAVRVRWRSRRRGIYRHRMSRKWEKTRS